jgi:hypothetical protein
LWGCWLHKDAGAGARTTGVESSDPPTSLLLLLLLLRPFCLRALASLPYRSPNSSLHSPLSSLSLPLQLHLHLPTASKLHPSSPPSAFVFIVWHLPHHLPPPPVHHRLPSLTVTLLPSRHPHLPAIQSIPSRHRPPGISGGSPPNTTTPSNMASTPATNPDTLVTLKINIDGGNKRFKLPLRDLGASTLPGKVRLGLTSSAPPLPSLHAGSA